MDLQTFKVALCSCHVDRGLPIFSFIKGRECSVAQKPPAVCMRVLWCTEIYRKGGGARYLNLLLDRIQSRVSHCEMQRSCTVHVPRWHSIVPVGAEEIFQTLDVAVQRGFMRGKTDFYIVCKFALQLSSFYGVKLLSPAVIEFAVEKIRGHVVFLLCEQIRRCQVPHPN